MNWGEVFRLLSDPAHVASELVWEVTFLLIGILISNWRVRSEHRKHHEEGLSDEPIPYTIVQGPMSAHVTNSEETYRG